MKKRLLVTQLTCKYHVCRSLTWAPTLAKFFFTASKASQHEFSAIPRASPQVGAVAMRHFVYNNMARNIVLKMTYVYKDDTITTRNSQELKSGVVEFSHAHGLCRRST